MYLPTILSISLLSLYVAFFFARQVLGADAGTAEMQVISNPIKKGAEGFLRLMRAWVANAWSQRCRMAKTFAASVAVTLVGAAGAFARPPEAAPSGEANLKLPDLSQVQFLGVTGHRLLTIGILFCIFGLLFGLVTYSRLKNLPVHRAMGEMSQLIWETCKTYIIQQGKFLLLLWSFIAVIILLYFGVLLKYEALR
ncbi:MAG: hypothetical protein ABSH01_29600, partial [Terriglobia bacterium]